MVKMDTESAGVYTDLQQLQNLKSKGNRNDPEALKKVAKDFEQIFLSMMKKSMRQANEAFGKDNFLNSSQVKFFEEMRDNQMTLELAHGGGIGLADVLVKQLSGTLSKVPTQSELEQTLSSTKPQEIAPGEQPVSTNLADFFASSEQQKIFGEQLQAPPVMASTPQPAHFDTPEQFVQTLTPMAEKAAAELGVEPRVLIAQAALETGWGKYISRDDNGRSSHNLFNIKADRRWDGDSVEVGTREFRNGEFVAEQADFRRYDSYQNSFDDYVTFIKSSPRYQQALAQADDADAYLHELQRAGYATDPEYANKILDIVQRPLMLAALDTQAR